MVSWANNCSRKKTSLQPKERPDVTAKQIIPEKILNLEKEYSRVYGWVKYRRNKKVKSDVHLL